MLEEKIFSLIVSNEKFSFFIMTSALLSFIDGHSKEYLMFKPFKFNLAYDIPE